MAIELLTYAKQAVIRHIAIWVMLAVIGYSLGVMAFRCEFQLAVLGVAVAAVLCAICIGYLCIAFLNRVMNQKIHDRDQRFGVQLFCTTIGFSAALYVSMLSEGYRLCK
ncbi:MAG: hypothetical protein AAGA76_11025 [Pseudomonadota bacterium]